MKNILIVGGAGYIGSHMVKAIALAGYHPITLDNLSTGFHDAVQHGELIIGSMGDKLILDNLFAQRDIAAVMHFAAYSQVGESVTEPAKYYQNNVSNTQVLLDAMIKHDVKQLVFSSTAAVYGKPEYTPIDEAHPKKPINPYGKTKWMIEQILEDYSNAYKLRSIALRYFNAAGADSDAELGERHDPETHLIPLVLQAGLGIRDSITVFGNDYDTRDGSCIRDYIHVEDLCNAHLLALQALFDGKATTAYNLGNGNGFSVREVISVAERILNTSISVLNADRRLGDPATLVANATRAQDDLAWTPKKTELEQIIADAATWEQTKHMPVITNTSYTPSARTTNLSC